MDKRGFTWLDASQIQPSQFYINREKLKALEEGFDPKLFEPIPVKHMGQRLVMTDGHTRACYLILEGYRSIPVIEETADLNWEAYRINVKDCQRRGVLSALDLPACIVSPKVFKERWDSYCDEVQSLVDASPSASVAASSYTPG
ncbi:MAG: hypothetical protein GX838_04165 [Clostridiaceae bacterium]|nr:hypothetical protein [Clostridiaceae bacterium]